MDPEHILGIFLLLRLPEPPAHLAQEADVIAQVARNNDEAAALIAFVAEPGTSPWGAGNDSTCASRLTAVHCAATFLDRWKEARRSCGDNIQHRFAYWNTGTCARTSATTARQYRFWSRARRELGDEPACSSATSANAPETL